MKKLTFAIIAVLGLGTNVVFAQTIDNSDDHTVTVVVPEVALLDIETTGPAKNFSLMFTAPIEEGLGLTAPASNTTTWLNYSSIVKSSTAAAGRDISVTVNTLVPGVDIKVLAAVGVMTAGAGAAGIPTTAQVTLTTGNSTIITGVKSCFTGDGSAAGHKVTYDASVSSFAALVSNGGGAAVTVTYTLADN